MMWIEEGADAGHDLDLASLCHSGKAAGQLLDDAILEPTQLVEIELRRTEGDAMVGEMLDLVDHGCRVQQRLARDAADIEADAAERVVALDQHGLHAEVGGTEGGGVAAGTGAQNQHVAFDIGLAGVRSRYRGDRRWRRSRPRRRRGCRRSGSPCGLEHQDHGSLAHLVIDLDPDLLHDAGVRRRDLHRRFVGFDNDQAGVDRNGLAGFHHHLDDGDVLEVADVRNLDFDLGHTALPNLRTTRAADRRAHWRNRR